MSYYPVFLNLRDRRCVVIGGNEIAEAKVRALLEAGARVTVIGKALTPRLEGLAAEGKIEAIRRNYQRGDLEGAWLAICCEERTINHAIWEEAEERHIFLNAVDDVPHCSFIAGAVHRQGDLIVAISTSGKAPALAVRLRDRIAAEVGPEYAAFLELAGEMREEIARRVPDLTARTELWYRLVDSNILQTLRRADIASARQRFGELIAEAEQKAKRR
ncbi:precorrin-2 dehydrogenase/sirohydrochlorin ferrochelatase family protein [Pyrinomonas methylaliphatogenes]|jgi:siroheme synthase-like protein|uniref:precorrin-2 dehydrogenase n=1 Tax=Pyrinomonas methylaliphatogenes TaxID=454194 RepID=A0A0B6X0T4_9BACT|nr:bifunctional precorrin-2 dehydrogenase/sirohydrochlorin ferrochelatase [Pyrinomonas methylaliphatogenes]MBX5478512.1 bifunctional precorrin-2 dehydrogenase/sirohydrochlorin ferrochelatase [Pyrinomonas methylaliphatogenes]CDM66154.1 siroheme synthase, N-terminal domain [Pyrinomonas methylaliphatogenes]